MKKKYIILFVIIFFVQYIGIAKASGQFFTVGDAGFSGDQALYTSLAIDSNNVPYVAYQDGANLFRATVKKFNGTSWETVGNAGFSTGESFHNSLALNTDGVPYVAFADQNGVLNVMKFNGTSWETVGVIEFLASEVSLVIDSNNVPYVAFLDSNTLKVTVIKFDGVIWSIVGNAGFSPGLSSNMSLALDSNNVPYVSYQDSVNGYKVTVMKLNGDSWEAVGNAGFSAGIASYTSLAIDSNNLPYVAFQDGANNSTTTIMKFNGTSWETVGNAGFSQGPTSNTSLALDSNDIPYVAYTDGPEELEGLGKLATQSSNQLVEVGSGFSSAQVSNTSLALDSNDIPYIAYSDTSNGGKASVTMFVSVPTITTSLVSGITKVSADLHGSLGNTGGASVTEHGFIYDIAPSLPSPTTTTKGAGGVGSFSQIVTGLTCNTTYYFKAYGTNIAGQGEGDISSFKTKACASGVGGFIPPSNNNLQEQTMTQQQKQKVVSMLKFVLSNVTAIISQNPNPTTMQSIQQIIQMLMQILQQVQSQ